MKKSLIKSICLLLTALLLASCFAGCTQQEAAEPQQAEEPQTDEQPQEESSSLIADASEKTKAEDVVDESYVPVYAESIKNGTYEIEVDSSSSMFKIVKCILTVTDDGMTADMTMGGTGYRYIYMGTPEEAVAAAESDYLLPEADAEGAHHYTVPVEALDKGIDCAAFPTTRRSGTTASWSSGLHPWV